MSRKPFSHFVIFDVETTGLSHRYGDRMIELAALKIAVPLVKMPDGKGWAYDLKAMRKAESFCSLLNVDRDISWGAFMVNGITNEMLKSAPRIEKILPGFLDFIDDACLIGHNVRFDLGFLASELSRLDLLMNETMFLDTVRMARRLMPELRRHSLLSLAQALGIEQAQQHRAMADVELTYEVFRCLLTIADRRDLCTVEELVGLCGGKYPSLKKEACR